MGRRDNGSAQCWSNCGANCVDLIVHGLEARRKKTSLHGDPRDVFFDACVTIARLARVDPNVAVTGELAARANIRETFHVCLADARRLSDHPAGPARRNSKSPVNSKVRQA